MICECPLVSVSNPAAAFWAQDDREVHVRSEAEAVSNVPASATPVKKHPPVHACSTLVKLVCKVSFSHASSS